MPTKWSCLLLMLLSLPASFCAGAIDDEATPEYWNTQAQATLGERLSRQLNVNVAKNVIIFVGDGMGIPTITAARIYKGQKNNNTNGEESQLTFDTFPHVGLIKTYNVDKQVPDSAGTATAMFCGVKTKYELIGVTAKTKVNNCSSAFGNEISSVLEWAQKEGKDTGFVTTTRVTHATPSVLYAHSAQRDWECDADKPANASDCLDIARQLIEADPGRGIKVILGGGFGKFLPAPIGSRNDSRNLTHNWLQNKPNGKYVINTRQLEEVDFLKTDHLLGLFDKGNMQYDADRNTGPEGQPSIKAMTKAAIQMLKKGNKGFFLLVEGGRIDHGHHRNLAKMALEETLAMDDAIKASLEMVDLSETLVVVTADHSHVMTINGYPARGNPILGIGGTSDMDSMPYTTLLYTNGPSYVNDSVAARHKLNTAHLYDRNYTQLAFFPNEDETHGGEDVGVFATGPMAHLFYGVQEQNYIAHAIGYAACIGDNKDHCKGSASFVTYNLWTLLFLFVARTIFSY